MLSKKPKVYLEYGGEGGIGWYVGQYFVISIYQTNSLLCKYIMLALPMAHTLEFPQCGACLVSAVGPYCWATFCSSGLSVDWFCFQLLIPLVPEWHSYIFFTHK